MVDLSSSKAPLMAGGHDALSPSHSHAHKRQPQVPRRGSAYCAHAPEPYAAMASRGDWSTELWDIFAQPGGANMCCLSLWCPCIQYGMLLEQLPPGSVTCAGSTTGGCALYGALWLLGDLLGAVLLTKIITLPCTALVHAQTRGHIRQKYGIQSHPLHDFFITWCCAPCALCQEAREAVIRQAAEREDSSRPPLHSRTSSQHGVLEQWGPAGSPVGAASAGAGSTPASGKAAPVSPRAAAEQAAVVTVPLTAAATMVLTAQQGPAAALEPPTAVATIGDAAAVLPGAQQGSWWGAMSGHGAKAAAAVVKSPASGIKSPAAQAVGSASQQDIRTAAGRLHTVQAVASATHFDGGGGGPPGGQQLPATFPDASPQCLPHNPIASASAAEATTATAAGTAGPAPGGNARAGGAPATVWPSQKTGSFEQR